MDLEAQTIRQMSSVWSWEAVERVFKASFEIFRVFGDSALDCELLEQVREYILPVFIK